MATMISAISAENSARVSRGFWLSSWNMQEETSWVSKALDRLRLLPAYVLFNHPKHGSTLALRLDQNCGTDAIRNRLAACDRQI